MPTIGLSMIVKDAADTLRPCLESVRGLVSQIVIADTGCSDATCSIAQEFGATIVSFPWENHYANARNAALGPVKTDWVLVLDADEELDRAAGRTIPELLTVKDIGGYATPIRNYVPAGFNRGWDRAVVPNDHRHPRAQAAASFFVHENCRFFRRDPGICFSGRVHELVEPQIKAMGLKIAMANFCIHHFGPLLGQEVRAKKAAYYRNLLHQRVQDNPNDAHGWIQLGLHEYECFNNPAEAIACLNRGLALEPRASEAWLFAGMILLDLGRYEEALAALDQDHRRGSCVALREQIRGDALHCVGRLPEARAAYQRAMKLTGDDPLLSSKLGYTEVKLGQPKTGLSRLRRAAKAAPGVFAVHDRLMKACIMAGRLPEAAEVAEALAIASNSAKLFLRAASIRAQLTQWERSENILSRGLEAFPDCAELQAARSEVAALRPADDMRGTNNKEPALAGAEDQALAD